MTQKQKFFPKNINMTPEQIKAYVEAKVKKENEAAIRHKQLTAIYIDRIDHAFLFAKFKDSDDVAAFHYNNRPNYGVMCCDFVSFYSGILSTSEASDEGKLIWHFVDRYFQERIALKYEYVRGL